MEALQIIEMLMMLFGAAILACWLAYSSTVIQDLKAMLGLSPINENIKPKKWRWFVKPFAFLWRELRELVNCPYCMSFWLGLFVALHYYEGWQAISMACITILFVEIYRKLTV